MLKKCNVCENYLDIKLFNKHLTTKDKRQNQCRPCRNKVQRDYRNSRNGLASQLVYDKTKKGFLVRCYRNMKSRVSGIVKKGNYKGLEILEKNSFYDFSINDSCFNDLFVKWVKSDYDRKKVPSIDRIDSSKGYVIGNIRWLTLSENSRLGAINRNKRILKGKVL